MCAEADKFILAFNQTYGNPEKRHVLISTTPVLTLLEAALTNRSLSIYLGSNALAPQWQQLLNNNGFLIKKDPDCALQNQTMINPFQHIFGYFAYQQAADESDTKKKRRLLLSAADSGNLLANYELAEQLISSPTFKSTEEQNQTLEKHLNQMTQHGTPGFILRGLLYEQLAKIHRNHSYLYQAAFNFQAAQEACAKSTAAIANATRAIPTAIFDFSTDLKQHFDDFISTHGIAPDSNEFEKERYAAERSIKLAFF